MIRSVQMNEQLIQMTLLSAKEKNSMYLHSREFELFDATRFHKLEWMDGVSI